MSMLNNTQAGLVIQCDMIVPHPYAKILPLHVLRMTGMYTITIMLGQTKKYVCFRSPDRPYFLARPCYIPRESNYFYLFLNLFILNSG